MTRIIMKKLLTAVLLIPAIWLGSTAFIGSKTQNEFNKNIVKINKLYAQHGVEFNITDYKKTFFDSVATLRINIVNKELKDSISKLYDLQFPINTEYHIEHGPILFQNGFDFGLSKISQNIEINSLFNKEMKEQFTKKSQITSQTVVSFSQIANYNVKGESIEMVKGKQKINIEPFTINGKTDIKNFLGKTKIVIPKISVIEDDKMLMIKSLNVDMDMNELLLDSLTMGTIDFGAKKVHLSDKENGALEFVPTVHIISKRDTEKTFSSKAEMTIDLNDTTAKKSLSDLDKIVLTIDVQGVGTEGMKQYQESIEKIQKKQAEIVIDLQKNPSNKEENYQKLAEVQQELGTALFSSLKDMLFKDKTLLSYSFKVETKDKKESQGEVLLGYTGDIDFTQTSKQIQQKIGADLFNLFKLKVDIKLNENHIKALPNGNELLTQLQNPMSQSMVKYQNENYIIKGHLQNRELIVNDENLTNTVLPLLQMLTQASVAQGSSF